MEILMPKTVLAAFVMICVCTLVAKGEADSGKKLIGIMETVSGIASEAIPLAKQEFPLLDAKFKASNTTTLLLGFVLRSRRQVA